MPIYHQGRKIKAVYHQGRKVREVWHLGRKIYSGKPVEVMPATPGMTDAMDWLHDTVQKYGLDYETATELPFDIDSRNATNMSLMFAECPSLTTVPDMDTSQVTNMSYMFAACSSLTTVPDMDTSQVTNMNNMFAECPSLTTVPDMDTSQVTNMSEMFFGCSSLTTVPDMDTSQVTDMRYIFYNCSSLTDGNVRLIGKHPQVTTTKMIDRSGLTREPFYRPDGTPIN